MFGHFWIICDYNWGEKSNETFLRNFVTLWVQPSMKHTLQDSGQDSNFPCVKNLKTLITHFKCKKARKKYYHRNQWIFLIPWYHFQQNLKLTNFSLLGPFWDIGPGLWALVGTTRAWPTNIVVPPIIPTTYAKKFPEIPESTWAKKLRLIFAAC